MKEFRIHAVLLVSTRIPFQEPPLNVRNNSSRGRVKLIQTMLEQKASSSPSPVT